MFIGISLAITGIRNAFKAAVATGNILQESSDKLLLEDGSSILQRE